MRRRQSKLPPNQVVGGDSFFKPKVQPKLAMGTPGDKYEVEADKAADQIVANGNQSTPLFPATPAVQKQSEEAIQQQPVVDSISSGIQLKANKLATPPTNIQTMFAEDLQRKEEENIQEKEEED